MPAAQRIEFPGAQPQQLLPCEARLPAGATVGFKPSAELRAGLDPRG